MIVPSSASNWGNIQAKVKDLLIRWHPDKNPGCPEKAVGLAAKISLAMGVWFNIGEKKCVLVRGELRQNVPHVTWFVERFVVSMISMCEL